jgi:hypothetical protein
MASFYLVKWPVLLLFLNGLIYICKQYLAASLWHISQLAQDPVRADSEMWDTIL